MLKKTMENIHEPTIVDSAAEIVSLARKRAENCYKARRLCCSEAVFFVCNQGFRGGLSPEAAIQLSSGFCFGFGGAGSVCGSLSGVVMALGLFLGPYSQGGMKKKEFRRIIKETHQKFAARTGSTNCTILLDKAKTKNKAKKDFCRMLTGEGAALAVETLITQRESFIKRADLKFLQEQDSILQTGLRKLLKGSS